MHMNLIFTYVSVNIHCLHVSFAIDFEVNFSLLFRCFATSRTFHHFERASTHISVNAFFCIYFDQCFQMHFLLSTIHYKEFHSFVQISVFFVAFILVHSFWITIRIFIYFEFLFQHHRHNTFHYYVVFSL